MFKQCACIARSICSSNAHAYLKHSSKHMLKHCSRHGSSPGLLVTLGVRRIQANFSPVDYIRLLFAYTEFHVCRTGKLEVRRGSLQGLRREYPGAGGDDAFAACCSEVSALP